MHTYPSAYDLRIYNMRLLEVEVLHASLLSLSTSVSKRIYIYIYILGHFCTSYCSDDLCMYDVWHSLTMYVCMMWGLTMYVCMVYGILRCTMYVCMVYGILQRCMYVWCEVWRCMYVWCKSFSNAVCMYDVRLLGVEASHVGRLLHVLQEGSPCEGLQGT